MQPRNLCKSELPNPANSQVVLVDQCDLEIGLAEKLQAHQGAGLLHRAFSLFLFREDGALLLQQRSDKKLLWPLFWSNSCCSHPFPGEDIVHAAERRAYEELGVSVKAEFAFKFNYHARYDEDYSERELCSVLCGVMRELPRCNSEEVANYEFLPWQDLGSVLVSEPAKFTPWLKLEWPVLLQKGYPRKLLD